MDLKHAYEDPLKIRHLKQIRDLTWKNRSLQEEAERYHSLYSQQLEENTRLRLENKGLLELNSKLQWQNDCYKNVHSDRSETAYEAAQKEIRSLNDEIAKTPLPPWPERFGSRDPYLEDSDQPEKAHP